MHKPAQEKAARAGHAGGDDSTEGKQGQNAASFSQSQSNGTSEPKPKYQPAKAWVCGNLEQLNGQIGFPSVKVPSKKTSPGALNERFWSQFYALQTHTIWEPDEADFYRYAVQSGCWNIFDQECLRKEMIEGIEAAADLWIGYKPLVHQCTARNLSGIIEQLKGEVHSKEFFAHPQRHCIHAANCVIRFQDDGTYAPESFSPEFRSRNASPFKYDERATCDDFKKKMLAHIKEDTRDLIQKYAGQCLLGYNHSQTILLMTGIENSSKTQLIRLIEGLVGNINVGELRTQFLYDRFEIGRLVGKTLLTGADVPAKFLSAKGAGALKKLVGGDILTAEGKSSNRTLNIYGTFNIIAGANSTLLVRLEGDQGAWMRRLLIADFPNPYIGDKVENVHEALLRKEGPGILKWALDGAVALLSDLRTIGRIALTDRQASLVTNLIMESDSLRLFVRGELVKTANSDDTMTTDEIYTHYAKFCVDHEWGVPSKETTQKEVPWLMHQVWQLPKSHDISRPPAKSLNGFRNVRFRKPDEADPV